MAMRELASRYNRELYCNPNVSHVDVVPGIKLIQAVNRFAGKDKDKGRSLLVWIDRSRSRKDFFEIQEHHEAEILWCKDQEVTNNAIGEATRNVASGLATAIVSIYPSSWCYTPLRVERRPSLQVESTEIRNFWDQDSLNHALEQEPYQFNKWEDVKIIARKRFKLLNFTPDAFKPLERSGLPFSPGSASRLLRLMKTLEDFKNAFDKQGRRTPEGHRIRQEYFIGKKKWFSDSSDTEKQSFRDELTFKHPKQGENPLFCPWHGKVKTPQLRIHFTWPIQANKPVYVAYVGPKITRKN